MKNFSVTLFAITFLFFACSDKNSYKTPEAAIVANVEFMNKEDFDGVMSTIHPESSYYSTTESLVKKIFDIYDLNYKLEKVKIIEENENEVKVEFVQITKKLKGPEFKNNRTTGVHTMKKDGESWKIFSTEVTDLEFL